MLMHKFDKLYQITGIALVWCQLKISLDVFETVSGDLRHFPTSNCNGNSTLELSAENCTEMVFTVTNLFVSHFWLFLVIVMLHAGYSTLHSISDYESRENTLCQQHSADFGYKYAQSVVSNRSGSSKFKTLPQPYLHTQEGSGYHFFSF